MKLEQPFQFWRGIRTEQQIDISYYNKCGKLCIEYKLYTDYFNISQFCLYKMLFSRNLATFRRNEFNYKQDA